MGCCKWIDSGTEVENTEVLIDSDTMSSNCKTCGEATAKTGNYSVRIIPAKRVPKKARKLMKTMANMDNNNDRAQQSLETSSFQKFLGKRAKPVNFMEITCGKCGATSKLKMFKQQPSQQSREESSPITKKVKESERNLMSPSIPLSSSSRKNKKKSRDLTAGLTIVMDSSKAGSGNSSTTTSSSSFMNSQQNPSHAGRKRPASAFQKQKELDNLKKVLFHSKKAKKSGSSLQDFLSGI